MGAASKDYLTVTSAKYKYAVRLKRRCINDASPFLCLDYASVCQLSYVKVRAMEVSDECYHDFFYDMKPG